MFGLFVFFFSSRRRHTRCALVTGVQTCALPIWRNEGAASEPVLIAGEPVRSGVDEMSLATKIAAGLCICPVVAAPPALVHKPTRDKIARAAGYVPKAQKPEIGRAHV